MTTTQPKRRLHYYREHLNALGLMASPYPGRWVEKDSAWRSGYEAALRDLAEHPEITKDAVRWAAAEVYVAERYGLEPPQTQP